MGIATGAHPSRTEPCPDEAGGGDKETGSNVSASRCWSHRLEQFDPKKSKSPEAPHVSAAACRQHLAPHVLEAARFGRPGLQARHASRRQHLFARVVGCRGEPPWGRRFHASAAARRTGSVELFHGVAAPAAATRDVEQGRKEGGTGVAHWASSTPSMQTLQSTLVFGPMAVRGGAKGHVCQTL